MTSHVAKSIAAKSVAALLAVSAFGLSPLAAQAASGLYLGIGAGVAENRDIDDTDTAVKAIAGYNFNETFGIEGQYVDFGETAGPGFRSQADTVAVEGVVNLPFTPRFGVFGKGGVHYASLDTTVLGVSRTDNETDATYGAGVKFDFTDYLGVRGEWERFEIEDADTDVLSASLMFKFM